MALLSGYQVKATNWREALRSNKNRTVFVIMLFLTIYLFLGFFIDLYIYVTNIETIDITAKRIATLQLLPIGTLIMFAVAIISLCITFFFHTQMVMLGTDYREVTADSNSSKEKQLYNIIEELKIAAGMRYMPKIYIIDASYMNAFASGFSEQTSLVAITQGLLDELDRSELQAVMAHELSHIRHNDIRLTLTVLVLSNIMLIAIDILFRGVLFSRSGRQDNRLIILILVIRFVLPILTMLLMLYLSRTREYMADSGSVELTRDNEPLARALLKIHANTTKNQEQDETAYNSTPHEEVRTASYFYDPKYAGIASFASINTLFSTHPPLEDRLRALGVELDTTDHKK
jgi:heat shock protein HtpX